jgi:hypothetical protein
MPKFNETFCSQCGKSFGPGDTGYSHCSDHRAAARAKRMADIQAKSAVIHGAYDTCANCGSFHYTHNHPDGRARSMKCLVFVPKKG